MQQFQNKYRTQSHRLKNYDYSHYGFYFVTVCVKKFACVFGDVSSEGTMVLNGLGEVADNCLSAIPNHFPFVEVINSIVMPNHVHVIIHIKENQNRKNSSIVETQNLVSLQEHSNKFGPQSKNLASIVRGFKIGVTKYARNNNINSHWQSNYHDHIIRDEKSLKKIDEYISANPRLWKEDKFNPQNI